MTHEGRNSGILDDREKFTAQELIHYQEGFLRDVVSHAYSKGTPLKQGMDGLCITPKDVSSLADLAALPVTRKKDLSWRQSKTPRSVASVRYRFTNWSASISLRAPSSTRWVRLVITGDGKTALYSVGFRPGDLVINTFAYHLTPAGHMFEEGVFELGATTIPVGVGNTQTQVEIIKSLGVTGYIGTPSFLSAVIEKAEEMGVVMTRDCRLEMALLLAEMVTEKTRQRLREEYNITARQAYGTADVGCVSYECPVTSGMHVHYDVIVEICDPDSGLPLPAGEIGEVVVTCNNKIYPLFDSVPGISPASMCRAATAVVPCHG